MSVRRLGLLALLAWLVVAPAQAGRTRHFVLDTVRGLSRGTGKGIAIYPDGSLRPLPPLAPIASFEEPLGLALAVGKDRAFVGTGHPARVWSVDRNGGKKLLGELAADQVTSLLLSPRGDLFAATAVPATLVRFAGASGSPEVVARLDEGNLWDLAWFSDGVVAAAGNPGRVLRLRADRLEPLFTVPDSHARSLAVAGDALLVGTSGKGLILRWSGRGPAGVLVDSGFTEIAALAVAPDGVAFAAGVTGDPTLGKPPKESGDATVTVSTETQTTPSTDKGPATSEVLRVLPSGAVTTAHRFAKQIAGTLDWTERGVVIGTGLEGELWQLVEGAAAQLDTVDATQVVRVAGGGAWVLTQGPVALMRRSGDARGSFTSPVLDAGQPADWGQVTVRARTAVGAACTIGFRSGATAEPDETWSAWSAPQPCGEIRASVPPARYLQWRVELTGAQAGPVEAVDVAYRQVNLPPEIEAVTVHDPGEIYLKSPPPSDRVIEVQHPDQSGIFTVIDESDLERQTTLGKRYYRTGYQTVSWKAADPNGDRLLFSLEVQREGSERWWQVRDRLEATALGLDTQALPDGVYRFRVTATDAPSNPAEPESEQALSSFVTVDNTPPRVTIGRERDDWLVTVEDELSPIVRFEWNRDADTWHAGVPEDGLLDGRRETFRIPVRDGRHLLAVRAVDDHHNRATAAVEEGS